MPVKPDPLWAQRLIVAFALSILGIGMGYGFYLEHIRVLENEIDRLQTQANVIDENIDQNFVSLNSVLARIRMHLPQSHEPGSFSPYLKTLTDGMPGVRTLVIADRNGLATSASRPELLGVDFSQHAYFQIARQAPDADMLYVSPPFRTPLGVYAINVSRVLLDADGAFAGVASATLDPKYFTPLLGSIRYRADMVVILSHWDGVRFLSLPTADGNSESNPMHDRLFMAHRESGREVSVSRAVKDQAGGTRLLIQKTIRPDSLKLDKPLVVEVDRSLDAVLATWRSEVRTFIMLYLLLFGVSVYGIHAYQRRQLEAEKREAEAAQALQASEHLMKTITDHLPAMIAYWTDELRCRFANGAFLEWFGKTPQEIVGMRIMDLFGEALLKESEPHIRAVLEGKTQQFERTLIKADGSTGYTWVQYIPDYVGGYVKGFFVLASDVTPIKEVQLALAESEWKLRTIIDTEPECVAILAADGTIQQINPAGFEMIGAESEARAIGVRLGDLILPQYRPAFDDLLADVHAASSGVLVFELIGLAGMHRWLECHAVPARDRAGCIVGALCVIRDITENKHAERELVHLAQIDFLTNLANRRHFMTMAEQELQRSNRYGSPLTVLMMDIDHFKKINDTHGHKTGDAAIQKFADACRASLRSIDIVGRIGGEEFAVLLPETDGNHGLTVATLLRQRIASLELHTEHGEIVRFTVSIGVASRSDANANLEAILHEADQALYEAKNSGRNKVCEYKTTISA